MRSLLWELVGQKCNPQYHFRVPSLQEAYALMKLDADAEEAHHILRKQLSFETYSNIVSKKLKLHSL